jgi:hypothetical protein
LAPNGAACSGIRALCGLRAEHCSDEARIHVQMRWVR